jgi:ferredoxin
VEAAVSERLHVDWTRCEARGLCIELLPELLAPDDWGYPQSRSTARTITVPSRLSGWAEQAVAECPRQALHLLPASHPGGQRPRR